MVQTYCPHCKTDVHARGLETGLQEILAYRIHVGRAHGVFVRTDQAAEHRATLEEAGAKPTKQIFIDVDRNTRWLDPNYIATHAKK